MRSSTRARCPPASGSRPGLAALRRLVLSSRAVERRAQEAIIELQQTAGASSRAGYLRTLADQIGRRPTRSWVDEWVALRAETNMLRGKSQGERCAAEYIARHESLESKRELFAPDIAKLVANGWTDGDATAVTLTTKCLDTGIAAALREHDSRYAATTYKLAEALFAAAKRQHAARQRDPTPADQPSRRFYKNLSGELSLHIADPAWAAIEVPDRTGFCGLYSYGLYSYGLCSYGLYSYGLYRCRTAPGSAGCIVLSYIVMAYTVMAYIVMTCTGAGPHRVLRAHIERRRARVRRSSLLHSVGVRHREEGPVLVRPKRRGVLRRRGSRRARRARAGARERARRRVPAQHALPPCACGGCGLRGARWRSRCPAPAHCSTHVPRAARAARSRGCRIGRKDVPGCGDCSTPTARHT